MSKKNIFLLAAWYLAWWIVASIYWKKKPEDLKNELDTAKESWKGSFKVIMDNFIDTHSNMIDDFKKELYSEKNKALFNEHKDEIIKIIDSYREKWNVLLDELREKGKSYVYTTSEKLEELYKEKLSEIEELKWVAPSKIDDLKNKLHANFQDLKSQINKIKK